MDENQQDSLFGNSPNSEEKVVHITNMPSENTTSKNKLLDFSYSRMDMFRTCPMKFKFRYVDKIREKPKGFFFFGSAIHAALEFLYKGDSPYFPSMEQVCQSFLEFWFSKPLALQGFRNAEESARKREEGILMLKEYYRVNQSSFKRAFLTERIFKFEIDGLLVTAISDRMDYLGNGKLLITDYKTGKDVRRTPGQLYMYQKIAECNPELPFLLAEKMGAKEERLQVSQMLYYHVPTNKKYFFDRATDKQISEFWDGALATAEEMKKGHFEPKPSESACRWCDYRQYCPVYGGDGKAPDSEINANQYATNAATIRQNSDSIYASGQIETLPQMIDRYGMLEERKAEIEKEMDALRLKISKSASPGEYETENYSASISEKKSWKAQDREAVISLLEQYGLKSQAYTLTMSGITSLLDKPGVPEDFKKKLLSLLKKEIITAIGIKKIR